ncbi:MAG: alcohol dehydrogenase catalytic domain-containing protein [Eubacteriaceae bacterium]|nr:alcohol dehydrogenase catalytic domain-containing protein [Eubacteriaceae bacterium]
MDAVVFYGPNDYKFEQTETPKCPVDGVLLKIMAVGLCGSDIRTFEFGHPKVKPPAIIGHEVVGIIEEVGAEVMGHSVGDRVALNPIIPCGECYYCKQNMGNQCKNLVVIGSQLAGGYAQYVVVPKVAIKNDCLHKISDDLSFDYAPLAETTASAYSTQEYVNVKKGDVVVIIGAGPLGNLHADIAKARGASKVIISEMNESRLEMAKRFKSIDVFVNPSKEDLKEVVLRETNGYGADVVIPACPVGAAQEQSLDLVKSRGRVLLFGGLPKDNHHIRLDSNLIHYKEIAIFGGYAYNPDAFKIALDIITENRIQSDQFVTHFLPLKDLSEGIRLIKSGEAIKVVLKPWQ